MDNIQKRLKTLFEQGGIYKGIITLIILCILSFVIMGMTFMYANASYSPALLKSYFTSVWLMLMNLIPVFIMLALIYFLSDRLWLGFVLTASLFLFASFVNKFKLLYRDEPFTLIDIKLFKESIIIAGKYNIKPDVVTCLFIALIIGITILLSIFYKTRFSWKIRGISILILGFISLIIFGGFYFNDEIYNKLGDKTLINHWKQTDHFRSKGFVYPFVYSIKSINETDVEGYDEKKAIEYLNEFEYKSIPSDQKVNIIAIMLEAYNDFSEFEGVELNVDIYKNFHKLQKESLSGKLITNVFAGNTINTERVFLTGFNYNPDYQTKTNSFIWYFKQQGYRTEAMHPITGTFYNRNIINEHLGFDSFDHYDNRYKHIQTAYLDDIRFFDYIIEGYENSKKKNQPYFNFSVTYQNHGPYFTDRRTDVDFLKKKKHYDEETFNIINNYFSGIAKTDKAIKKLIDYFRDEEATIVIIFGDHNPWLGQDNTGYDMLNIDLDPSTVDGFKNYYSTPYIIWGNDAAKKMFKREFKGKANEISPNFLMAELFEYVGWQGNQYMQFILRLKGLFDVNHKLYFKEEGVYVSELKPGNKKIWNDYRNVEQYLRYNFLE